MGRGHQPGYKFQVEDDEFMSAPTVNISDWDVGNVKIVVSKVTFV